jgi:D-sedoheptulose 7-phosphate isomerase
MTGFKGGASAKAAHINLHVEAHNYGFVEDVHQSMMHVLSQYVRHHTLSITNCLAKRSFDV